MKLKKIEITLVLALVFCMLFNIGSFCAKSEKLSGKVLRLHILANSDSEKDQDLKLKVRDAILKESGFIFENVKTINEAKRKATQNLYVIEKIANDTLKKEGSTYTAKARLEKTFFETRYYNDFTMPAGVYDALRIVIGEGNGHNWWCVMFPCLCISTSVSEESLDTLTSEQKQLIFSNPNVEVRFKCVEIYEKIKNSLKNG